MMQDYLPYHNFRHNYVGAGNTSVSAIPRVWSNAQVPSHQPFFSPPVKMHRLAQTNRSVTEMYGSIPNRFQPPHNRRDIFENSISQGFHVQDRTTDAGQDGDRYHEGLSSLRKEPMYLHMWIIKPVPDSQNICVEGKKSLSEEVFWHSDIITERLDEKTVVSSTGSVYKLEGNMELMDAMAVGFSRELVEAFWLGFPPDWKSLIVEHFQTRSNVTARQTSPQAESEKDEVLFVEEVDSDDMTPNVSDKDSMKASYADEEEEEREDDGEESVEADMQQQSEDEDDVEQSVDDGMGQMSAEDEMERTDDDTHEQFTDDEDDIVMSEAVVGASKSKTKKSGTKAKTKTNNKATLKDTKTQKNRDHILNKWHVKFLADGKGIYVVGEKTNGSYWHSSAIEKRLSGKRLLSSTGSVYKLVGNMDKLVALSEDLPLDIIDKFKKGFPKEWQELVQEHFATTRSHPAVTKQGKSRTKMTANGNKKSQVVDDEDKVVKRTDKKASKTAQRKRKSCEELDSSLPNEKKKKKSKTIEKSSSVKKKQQSKEEDEKYESRTFVITPRGQLVDLSTLGRSRSGRLIKPPLHSRQSVTLDGDNVVVSALSTGASQFLKKFENQFQNHKLKSYYNPRQKDMDYSILSKPSSKKSSASSKSGHTGKAKKENKTDVQLDVSMLTEEAVSSEETDHSEGRLEVQVKAVLEENKSKRQQSTASSKKRATCYNNQQVSDSVDLSNNSRNKEVYDLDETCESIERTVVSEKTALEDTDSDNESVIGSRRKQASGNRSSWTKKPVARLDTDTEEEEEERKEETRSTRCTRGTRLRSNKTLDNVESSVANTSVKRQNKIKKSCVSEKKPTTRRNSIDKAQEKSKSSVGRTRKARLSSTGGEDEPTTCNSRRTSRSCSSRKTSCVVITDSESDSDHKAVSAEPVAVGKRRGRPLKTPARAATVTEACTEERTEEDDDCWTKEEKEELYRACKAVPVDQPNYWQRVSKLVGSKSAESCNSMFYNNEKAPASTKKSKKTTKEKPRVTAITAKAGTLKRKQQLTDILKQHNENYEDDLFDSTPFRKTRRRKMPVLNDLGDKLFEELARKQGHKAFETPKGNHYSEGHDVPFASPEKTPGAHLTSDLTEQSFQVDGYVHNVVQRQMKTRRISRGKNHVISPMVTKSKNSVSPPPSMNLFQDYLNTSTKENHEDSEQEEDYYWEDESADVSKE